MQSQQASDAEFMEVIREARTGEALTALELDQFGTLQQAIWRYRENVSYQYRNGLFDEDE